ncbi:hypothetical protein [Nocardia tenerifensis]|uniref:hypothetical protein n=1 Tax=Nocardia tenerifensis TaxID=228006 RepID=UPI000593BF3E|nr:hypothetical protein [Nocardia tenerifensis]
MTALKKARRRMVPVAALAAGAAIALTGCSSGQISQTADQVAAINGNHADVGKIALRNVHIVFPAQGSEYTNAKAGKAIIALSIINNSPSVPDELTSLTTDLGPVKITPAAGKSTVELAPQQTVVAATKPVKAATPATDAHGAAPTSAAPTSAKPGGTEHAAEPAATAEDPEARPILIEITNLSRDITPGLTYNVAFNFKQNGTVQVQVPVDAGATERHESDKSGAAEAEHKGGH